VGTLTFIVSSLRKLFLLLCVLFPKVLLSKAYNHSSLNNTNQKEKKQSNKKLLSNLCPLSKTSTFIYFFSWLSPSGPVELSLLQKHAIHTCHGAWSPSSGEAGACRDLSRDAPDPHGEDQGGRRYLPTRDNADTNKPGILTANTFSRYNVSILISYLQTGLPYWHFHLIKGSNFFIFALLERL